MSEDARAIAVKKLGPYNYWGPFVPLGLVVLLVVLVADQGHKWWMLNVVDIARVQPVRVFGFMDLVLVWNTGVSYGWFRWLTPPVLAAFQIAVTIFLWSWLATARSKTGAVALGLVIGGALGNIIDRLAYGAVADFVLLHGFGYSWYVFNLADVAIVAGAALIVYDLFRTR